MLDLVGSLCRAVLEEESPFLPFFRVSGKNSVENPGEKREQPAEKCEKSQKGMQVVAFCGGGRRGEVAVILQYNPSSPNPH